MYMYQNQSETLRTTDNKKATKMLDLMLIANLKNKQSQQAPGKTLQPKQPDTKPSTKDLPNG